MTRRTGDLASEVARRLARCVRDGDCLVVPDLKDWYGVIRYDGGRQMSTHRASYIAHKGPVPDGLVIRHICDRPACMNPDHLIVGTHQDNENDKWERGRGAFGLRIPKAKVAPSIIEAAVAEYLQGGKSQAEMGRQLGVGATTFGRWVRAESRTRDANLTRMVVGNGSRIATGLQPCGTRAGWFRHRRAAEPICEPCRQANITYFRAYRAKKSDLWLGGAA